MLEQALRRRLRPELGEPAIRTAGSSRHPPMHGNADECGSSERRGWAAPEPVLAAPSSRAADRWFWHGCVDLGADHREPDTAYFGDHRLQDVPSASTSAMVEMMLTAASPTLGTEALEIEDLELLHAFMFRKTGSIASRQFSLRAPSGPRRFEGAITRGRAAGARTPGRAPGVPPASRVLDPTRPSASDCRAMPSTRSSGVSAFSTGLHFRESSGCHARARGSSRAFGCPAGSMPRRISHPAFHDAAMHVALLGLAWADTPGSSRCAYGASGSHRARRTNCDCTRE